MPRRPGEGRRPDFRGRSAPELAVPRRRLGGRHLPAVAHRAGRHADAVVRRPDRPEVPDGRGAVAAGAVRALALAGGPARRARRGPCPGDPGHGARLPGRFGVDARGPFVVPPRGPGHPQVPLVCAGGGGRVGASPARRQDARAAGELGRPHREPRHGVAQVRAAHPRDGRRRRFQSRTQGGALARGIERFDTLPGAPAGEATYEHGEWRLVLTRALATPDTANEVQLEAGRAIPMAFFAWDGSSGEHGSRMAVSTWYFLALDRPTPPGVFISPVLAMLVTLGLGLVVVRRAQRRGATRSGV